MKSGHWGVGLAIAVGLVGGACSAPAHLTEGYGESYRESFSRQALRPLDQCAEPVTGLDSQEASIISDGYRRSLAPKGATSVDEESLIYLAPPPRGNGQQKLPPPSVPQEKR